MIPKRITVWPWDHDSEESDGLERAVAAAAIASCAGKAVLHDLKRIIARQEQELAEAQTELAGLRAELEDGRKRTDLMQLHCEMALAEIERLRVCANCGYCSYSAGSWWCGVQAPEEVAASDRCRFNPSCWKEPES